MGLYTSITYEDNDIFQVVHNFDIDKIGYQLISDKNGEPIEVYPNLRFDPEETKWIVVFAEKRRRSFVVNCVFVSVFRYSRRLVFL